MIKSRSGHTVTFDDSEGTPRLVIKSHSGHMIILDDSAKQPLLVIADLAGSAITLNAKDGSVTIEAKQNLTIKAGGTVSLEAAGGQTKIVMDATQVDVT